MSSQTLAIETIGLSKHFGQHRAVDTLDLAIHQGSSLWLSRAQWSRENHYHSNVVRIDTPNEWWRTHLRTRYHA